MILIRGTEECSFFWLPIFSCDWKNILDGSKHPSGLWGGYRGDDLWSRLGSWPCLPFASAMFSLGTMGRAKGRENEIHREFYAEKCDKHQQKE